ncbi:hypothetical protein XI07_04240 [Bradyrhizobium sp. CCBAU 11445]|nr:hypothetical protein [Bradyrhizobium sp. CCBAU 11445]
MAVEYGGTGWNRVKQYIFTEKMSLSSAPAPLSFGVNMVGPAIYTFGNEPSHATKTLLSSSLAK